MPRIRGHIILVQEDRFRLVDEQGKSYMFGLAHNSGVNGEDLLNWSKAQADLSIEYEGEPEVDSGVAHSVRIMERRRSG